MDELSGKTIGSIRISLESICKALGIQEDVVSMHVDREDRNILVINAIHPGAPIWRKGKRIPEIKVERRYLQDGEE
jgi:hypothetical protein